MAARNVLTFRPSWNRHLSAESEASRAARWAAGSDASFFRGAMIPCFVPTRAGRSQNRLELPGSVAGLPACPTNTTLSVPAC